MTLHSAIFNMYSAFVLSLCFIISIFTHTCLEFFSFNFPNSRFASTMLPLFVTQIHLLSSFHAHVIAIHPSRSCPSVVVVPFKATSCLHESTMSLHALVTSANFIYINYLCDAIYIHILYTIMCIRS